MVKAFIVKVDRLGNMVNYREIHNIISGTIYGYTTLMPSTLSIEFIDNYTDFKNFLYSSSGRNMVMVIANNDVNNIDDNRVMFFGSIDNFSSSTGRDNMTMNARTIDVSIYADKFESMTVLYSLLKSSSGSDKTKYNIFDYITAVRNRYGLFMLSNMINLGNMKVNTEDIMGINLFGFSQRDRKLSTIYGESNESSIFNAFADMLKSHVNINFSQTEIVGKQTIHLDEISNGLLPLKNKIYVDNCSNIVVDYDYTGVITVDKSGFIKFSDKETEYISEKRYRKVVAADNVSISYNLVDVPTMHYVYYMQNGATKQKAIQSYGLDKVFGTTISEVDLRRSEIQYFDDDNMLAEFGRYLSFKKFKETRNVTIENPSFQYDNFRFQDILVVPYSIPKSGTSEYNPVWIPIDVDEFVIAFDNYNYSIQNVSGKMLINKSIDSQLIEDGILGEYDLIGIGGV